MPQNALVYFGIRITGIDKRISIPGINLEADDFGVRYLVADSIVCISNRPDQRNHCSFNVPQPVGSLIINALFAACRCIQPDVIIRSYSGVAVDDSCRVYQRVIVVVIIARDVQHDAGQIIAAEMIGIHGSSNCRTYRCILVGNRVDSLS